MMKKIILVFFTIIISIGYCKVKIVNAQTIDNDVENNTVVNNERSVMPPQIIYQSDDEYITVYDDYTYHYYECECGPV